MKSGYSKIWIGMLLAFVSAQFSYGQVVTVSVNNWMETIDENDLTVPLEAGYDIDPVIETSTNYNQLDVLNVANAKDWKITVSRRDINWPGALTLSVKRTSLGTPCMGCAGVDGSTSPATYVPVTGADQDFIFGTGEVNNVNIQMRIEGLSLTIDADTYSTEIIYTLFGD